MMQAGSACEGSACIRGCVLLGSALVGSMGQSVCLIFLVIVSFFLFGGAFP